MNKFREIVKKNPVISIILASVLGAVLPGEAVQIIIQLLSSPMMSIL